MSNKNLVSFLEKYLGSNFEAIKWIFSYIIYAHAIDDIVDCKFDKEDKMRKLLVVRTFELGLLVFSNIFYISNMHILYPLMKMASNSYIDSIVMEDSDVEWKRNYADFLRHQANDVILATIEIASGMEKRIEASLELRESSYKEHHDQVGNPC